MIFAYITLLTALTMAATAAAFAIFGIVAIFAGLPTFAMIMGIVIETGKIVGVSWIYRNWEEDTVLKYAMIPPVLLAMALTSMGIFGLLSQAHIEQSSAVATNEMTIARLDDRIARQQRTIDDAQVVIDQLDETVNTLIEFSRISGPDGARAVREQQEEQRAELALAIAIANDALDDLLDQRAAANLEIQALEREIGPVKYLAELVYRDEIDVDQAVRWVIVAFIFVFDPMAILLLMGAHFMINRHRPRVIEDGDNVIIPKSEISSTEGYNLGT